MDDWPFTRGYQGRRLWQPLGRGTYTYVVPDDRAEELRAGAKRYFRPGWSRAPGLSFVADLRYRWWLRAATRGLEHATPPLDRRAWLTTILRTFLFVLLVSLAVYILGLLGWLHG